MHGEDRHGLSLSLTFFHFLVRPCDRILYLYRNWRRILVNIVWLWTESTLELDFSHTFLLLIHDDTDADADEGNDDDDDDDHDGRFTKGEFWELLLCGCVLSFCRDEFVDVCGNDNVRTKVHAWGRRRGNDE